MEISGKTFKRWRRERDAMIEKQDVQEFKRFYEKWRAFGIYNEPLPADRVIEIALRRMALECTRTSPETKLAAIEWLLAHGFKLPEGEGENGIIDDKESGPEGVHEAPGAEDGEGADVPSAGT